MIFPKDGKYVCKKCGFEGEVKKKADKPKDAALENSNSKMNDDDPFGARPGISDDYTPF